MCRAPLRTYDAGRLSKPQVEHTTITKRASTEGFDLRGEPAVATIAMPLQRPRRLLVAFVAATFLLLGKLVTVTLAMCQACLLRPQAARVASGGQAQSRPEPCTLGSLVPEP